MRKRTVRAMTLCAGLGVLACGGGGVQPGAPPAKPGSNGPVVDTKIDYEEALRGAAIKLTGNLPSLDEIKAVRDAGEGAQAAQLEKTVDDYLSRPGFAAVMVDYFRDVFKMGGQDMRGGASVNMDHAPNFAAMLVVTERPFTEIVTATKNTCQTLDRMSGKFTTAACPNPAATGVLTDAGVQAQFYSAMAFRRVRWVQETFACRKFPTEIAKTSEQRPGGAYVSPWPYDSLTGKLNNKSARIDFQDDKSIICANCHTTMNHLAPLFARFTPAGMASPMIQVKVPIPMEPTATLTDWLPAQEMTAWRLGVPAADLPALGAAIAADPAFGRCVATRVWNWALSRPDVVEDGATLTDELANKLVKDLSDNNWNVKTLIKRAFTSDAFVRY